MPKRAPERDLNHATARALRAARIMVGDVDADGNEMSDNANIADPEFRAKFPKPSREELDALARLTVQRRREK